MRRYAVFFPPPITSARVPGVVIKADHAVASNARLYLHLLLTHLLTINGCGQLLSNDLLVVIIFVHSPLPMNSLNDGRLVRVVGEGLGLRVRNGGVDTKGQRCHAKK